MQNLGRYAIIDRLGEGAMGIVYKARDPMMDRDVAIKTILVHASEGPDAAEFRERFFREAKAAGRLSHPGIVTVFDVSEHEGTPFLVMEFIAGRTLLSILQSGGRMDTARACKLGIQLSEALDYAHRNGVVHRDIKPANILITDDDRLKVADFGVAKLTETQQTIAGQLLGTPAFMAPEHFTGMPIDGRSDLFSTGVVLYWMATGEKPFAADTVLGVQYKVVNMDPLRPRTLNPAISESLEAVILKCIEKDPARRYQSGEELARDLRALPAPQTISATQRINPSPADDRTVVMTQKVRTTPAPRVPATAASQRRVTVALIGAIAFVLSGLGVATFFLLKNPGPATSAKRSAARSSASVKVEKIEQPVVEIPKAAEQPDVNIENPQKEPLERKIETHRAAALPLPALAYVTPVKAGPARVEPVKMESANAAPAPVADLTFRDHKQPPALAPVLIPRELANNPKSVRLMISSPSVPEALTITVTVDNELIFNRNATKAAPFGFESLDGRIRLLSVPMVSLSEERQILPGKRKVEVSALMGSRRVAKVQEITARFDAGDRRVLQIEFLPESSGNGPDSKLFKITLK